MIATNIRTTGFADLDAKLQALGNSLSEEVMRDAMFEAARPLAELASNNAKRDSGEIANSIRVGDPRTDVSKAQRKLIPPGTLVVVGASARDARFLEFGTVKHKAQPFLRPAMEADRTNLFQRFAAALRRRLV